MYMIVALFKAHPAVFYTASVGISLFFLTSMLRWRTRVVREKRLEMLRSMVQQMRRASVAVNHIERRRVAGIISMIRRRCAEWHMTLADACTNERELKQRLYMIKDRPSSDEIRASLPLRYPEEQGDIKPRFPLVAAQVPLQEICLSEDGRILPADIDEAIPEINIEVVTEGFDDEKVIFLEEPEIIGIDANFDEDQETVMPSTLCSVQPSAQTTGGQDTFSQQLDQWISELTMLDDTA